MYNICWYFSIIAFLQQLGWLSLCLVIPFSFGDKKDLATRMGMPVSPCTRCKGYITITDM